MNARSFFTKRWAPLLLVIPLAYLLWPVFWRPLDYRFYNYFQSLRRVPPAKQVAVVAIDEETASTEFDKPLYPLSRHIEEHALVTGRLHEAGARMIVFDLELSEPLFDTEPAALARAFEEYGPVVLVMPLPRARVMQSGSHAATVLKSTVPDPLLREAAAAVCVVNVAIDPDGVLRRFKPSARARQLGLPTLPEYLSGTTVDTSVPIDFPGEDQPLPVVSYRDVLRGREDALARLDGRIVFVGSILDASGDYIVVPAPQTGPGGAITHTLPGVTALAAITETLLRGRPLRDAAWAVALLWNLIWCLAAVSLMPAGRAVSSVIVFLAVLAAALAVTGVLHAHAGFIFPAGLLLGCLILSGGFRLVSSHLQTSRTLVRTLERSRDELEAKVRERTHELSQANAELTETLDTLRKTQAQLIQAEKMASIGNLAAGVAHEINNPAGAVNSSADTILRCIEKIMSSTDPGAGERDEAIKQALDIMKGSTTVVTDAGRRISAIVNSLKSFTRLDEADYQAIDIHEGLESTLTLLQHKITESTGIEKRYGTVPPVECYPGELNQVFMHLLTRAIGAIQGAGTITITTWHDDAYAYVEIADTGETIPPAKMDTLFDPAFSTRGERVQSELGLSISYTIIQKHRGEIRVESSEGAGSTFTIVLPLPAA